MMPDGPGSPLPRLLSDPHHGPLPALLLVLTVLTGVVDAVSILSLGRVFVANMTGNVVFVGFALAGASGFSLSASLSALAGFLVGAFGGGIVIDRSGTRRANLLRNTAAVELVLLTGALALAAVSSTPYDSAVKVGVAAMAAVALGLQNSTARRLAVPDLTTTVLTMTLTGIAADIRGGNVTVAMRRLLAVVCMLAGAVAGALLVLNVSPPAALALGVGLVSVVVVGAALASARPADWDTPQPR